MAHACRKPLINLSRHLGKNASTRLRPLRLRAKSVSEFGAGGSGSELPLAVSRPVGYFKGLSPEDCENVTTNVTSGKISFKGGGTLRSLVGQEVVIVVELLDAVIYTIDFT